MPSFWNAHRVKFHIYIASLLFALAASGAIRPNIIVVLADDQGYGDLSSHGNPVLKTPNIDAFYRQSVRFTDFNVSPTCAPTRSALMTGRHEFRNGVTHTIFERERMTTNAVTIAQVLKSAGYTTGIFGKWHLGDEAPYQPDRRGFDEVFIHGGGGIGQTYEGSCGDVPANSYFNPILRHNGRFEKTRGYCTDVFFAQAMQWIDTQRTNNRPFFIYLPLNAPHAPLNVPTEYRARYAGQVSSNAANFFGMIANLDDNFGRLTTKLREWNIETNTLVVFMTDNGGTAGVQVFNAGMRGAKASPWHGGIRVPSLWRWPAGFPGGVDCDKFTAHIDVFPTLAEIAGAQLSQQAKSQVEGRSLVPLLNNPNAEWADRTLVTHVGRWGPGKAATSKYRQCSVRNSRFQLISIDTPSAETNSPNWQLFDLESDPGEKRNVLREFPRVARELEQTYDRWWTEIQPMLVNENVPLAKANPFKELYWQQLSEDTRDALRHALDTAR